jgi:hypothetical protein
MFWTFKNVRWALRQYVENQPTCHTIIRPSQQWVFNHTLLPRVSGHKSRTRIGSLIPNFVATWQDLLVVQLI